MSNRSLCAGGPGPKYALPSESAAQSGQVLMSSDTDPTVVQWKDEAGTVLFFYDDETTVLMPAISPLPPSTAYQGALEVYEGFGVTARKRIAVNVYMQPSPVFNVDTVEAAPSISIDLVGGFTPEGSVFGDIISGSVVVDSVRTDDAGGVAATRTLEFWTIRCNTDPVLNITIPPVTDAGTNTSRISGFSFRYMRKYVGP